MPTAAPTSRFHLTPGSLIALLLGVEVLLWLSNWLGWPALHKGYAVLTCMATVGVGMIVMLLWFFAALTFRWRFQFSIRSLLVLAVVVAVPCSWFAVEIKKAERQRAAKAAFQRFPGYVMHDYERAAVQPAWPAPPWLCRSLGDDFFAPIEFVCLGCDKRFTDADMEYLDSLPGLRMLRLGGANISDVGLRHLAALTTSLEDLSLSRTQVDDVGLENIQALTQLHRLSFYATNVSDAGLKCLKPLTKLRTLSLGKTKITDAGLQHLAGLNQLQVLDLTGTQATDQGVKMLQQDLPNCRINR
jgi:hypothetical protein